MNIQFARFSTGGFVLHKIMINGRKFSAWFDKTGKIVDCERVSGGASASVPRRCRQVWTALQQIGRRYL